MRGGTQAALALGVGYVLGRRRKMRMATVVAAAEATGGLGGAALWRGVKMLSSIEALGKFAPQLGELADTVRGDLMDAGRSAATAALTNRIESLTDSLHERAELVRDPGAAATGAGKAARSSAGKARSAAVAATRRPRRGQEVAADEETTGLNGEEPYPEDVEEQEGYEPGADEEAEEPAAEADEPDAAPVRRRAPRRRSPVARAGR